jgi:hypothetical protein
LRISGTGSLLTPLAQAGGQLLRRFVFGRRVAKQSFKVVNWSDSPAERPVPRRKAKRRFPFEKNQLAVQSYPRIQNSGSKAVRGFWPGRCGVVYGGSRDLPRVGRLEKSGFPDQDIWGPEDRKDARVHRDAARGHPTFAANGGCKNKTALECRTWRFRPIELVRRSNSAANDGEGLFRQTIE